MVGWIGCRAPPGQGTGATVIRVVRCVDRTADKTTYASYHTTIHRLTQHIELGSNDLTGAIPVELFIPNVQAGACLDRSVRHLMRNTGFQDQT